MALRVWLPLNGTLENKGISDVTVTNNGATVDNNGKIGKCYNFTGSSLINIPFGNGFNGSDLESHFSITAWIKFPDASSGNKQILAFSSNSGWGNVRATMLYRTANPQAIFSISDGTNYVGYNFNITITPNEWQHLAITFENKTLTWYLNGVFQKTYTTTYDPKLSDLTGFSIGGAYNGAEKFTGYINDVRIYDHCLSALEVKEISQGLVLHYKLDEFNSGKIINWFGNGHYLYDCTYEPSSHPAYHVSHWGGSVRAGTTKDENYQNKGTVYVTFKTTENVGAVDWSAAGNIGLQYSKHQINPSDTRFNDMLPILMNINIGEYFTVSFESKCSDATYPYKIRTRIVTKLSSETSTTSTEINTTTFTTANSWDIYSATFQMTQTLYNRIHDSTNDRLILLFDIWYANTATMANNVTLELRKFQFELGNTRHEWERSMYDYGIMDVIVKDSSGYGYNGVVTGVPEINDNTSRYTNSIKFLKNTAYIKLPEITYSNFGSSYTFSWWEYMTTVSGGPMPWGFSNGNRLNCYHTTNLCWNTGDGSSNPFTPTKTAASLVDNKWHHMAITGDGTDANLYIDGVYVAKATTWKPLTGTQIYISGWDTGTSYTMVNNSMADFRIYATALSADDILDLYHTPVNIDNLGGLHAFEIVETETSTLSDFTLSSNNWVADGVTVTYGDDPIGGVIATIVPSSGSRRIYHNVSNVWITGQTYLVSFLAKCSATGTITPSRSLADNGPAFSITTDWKQYYGLITSTATPGGGTLSLTCAGTNTYYISNIKLELADQNLIHAYKNGIIADNWCDEINFENKASFLKTSSNIIANNFIEK